MHLKMPLQTHRNLFVVIVVATITICIVYHCNSQTYRLIEQTTQRYVRDQEFYHSLPHETTFHLISQCQKFNLITMFFSVNSQPKYMNFSREQVDKRDKEYLEVLQSNLNHHCVERIHLFYINDVDLKVIVSANLTSGHKLHPVKRQRLLHMSDFFIYASRNLINKPVVGMNGDIMLGEGFEYINVERMLKDKLLYSLTRYEGNLQCSSRRHMCLDNYPGSHDTHIFALAEPLNETLLLEKLDYPTNMNQAENGMIYTMRYLFNYNVTNPCLTVKTYHHHCSHVHGGGEDVYTIYNLGWNSIDVHKGEAKPGILMPHPDLSFKLPQ